MSEYLLLKEAIKKKHGNISVVKFAKLMGMKQNTVYRHVVGTSEARYSDLVKYAEHFDVDIRDLFKGTKENCYLVHLTNPPNESLLK